MRLNMVILFALSLSGCKEVVSRGEVKDSCGAVNLLAGVASVVVSWVRANGAQHIAAR